MNTAAVQHGKIRFAFLLLFLTIPGSNGSRGIATSTMEQRNLQATRDYEFDATALYDFAFEGPTPETNVTVADAVEVLRLTEIYYRRIVGAAFPLAYQDVAISYKSHHWEPLQDTLAVDFGASVTLRLASKLPSLEEIMAMFRDIDSKSYIKHISPLATPPELFSW